MSLNQYTQKIDRYLSKNEGLPIVVLTEAVSVDAQPVELKNISGTYNKLAIAFGAVGAVLLVVAIILLIRNKRLREGRF